jgi:GNAT superfamily N-acetyltransferase
VIFSVLNDAAQRGELRLVDGGLMHYHRRRDGQTTIREIIVLPEDRRRGIGRRLVESLWMEGGRLLARCPVGYEANGFWPKVGFVLKETMKGVNVWVRD